MRLHFLLSAHLAFALAAPSFAIDDYKFGPDCYEHSDVPKGEIKKLKWTSKIFPETERDWAIYVPAQYDGKTPACVMVFQDGFAYIPENSPFSVPTVLDNLIYKKEVPVMIGIFVQPGNVPAADGKSNGRSNRSFEYDTLSDQYARFLEQEILPEVGKSFKLRQDAAGRGIAGASSGGICAFTAAWERPDLFSKVLSHIGSFTNIRGGDVYPGLIRKAPRKPIKVYLQDGSNDLDNLFGHWPLANMQMAASLRFMKYEYHFELGDGGHSRKHGGALMPESLKWLWRDTPPAPEVK